MLPRVVSRHIAMMISSGTEVVSTMHTVVALDQCDMFGSVWKKGKSGSMADIHYSAVAGSRPLRKPRSEHETRSSSCLLQRLVRRGVEDKNAGWNSLHGWLTGCNRWSPRAAGCSQKMRIVNRSKCWSGCISLDQKGEFVSLGWFWSLFRHKISSLLDLCWVQMDTILLKLFIYKLLRCISQPWLLTALPHLLVVLVAVFQSNGKYI